MTEKMGGSIVGPNLAQISASLQLPTCVTHADGKQEIIFRLPKKRNVTVESLNLSNTRVVVSNPAINKRYEAYRFVEDEAESKTTMKPPKPISKLSSYTAPVTTVPKP